MTVTVLGLDPSTKSGIAVLTTGGEVLHSEVVKYPKGLKAIPRAISITNSIMNIYSEYQPDHVVLEGYSLHSKFNLASMVELGTVLRLALTTSGIDYHEVAPTALKKFVSGKGNCKKDVMILECYKRFGFETDDDNIADAVGLAHIGLSLNNAGIGMPKVNLTALEKVALVKGLQS